MSRKTYYTFSSILNYMHVRAATKYFQLARQNFVFVLKLWNQLMCVSDHRIWKNLKETLIILIKELWFFINILYL